MVQRDRRSLVFKILTVTLFLILLVGNACLGQPITRAPGPTTIFPGPSTQQTIVLNLLNGQQYFGVPHVYQGDNDGAPTNSYPVYFGPSTASQYWSPVSPSINQPVLMMVPNRGFIADAMFWSETYSGGLVRITIIGTYTFPYPFTVCCGYFNGTYTFSDPYVGDGFVIYLFLNPTKWGISPQ